MLLRNAWNFWSGSTSNRAPHGSSDRAAARQAERLDKHTHTNIKFYPDKKFCWIKRLDLEPSAHIVLSWKIVKIKRGDAPATLLPGRMGKHNYQEEL